MGREEGSGNINNPGVVGSALLHRTPHRAPLVLMGGSVPKNTGAQGVSSGTERPGLNNPNENHQRDEKRANRYIK